MARTARVVPPRRGVEAVRGTVSALAEVVGDEFNVSEGGPVWLSTAATRPYPSMVGLSAQTPIQWIY